MSPPVKTRSALLNVRRTTRLGSKRYWEVTVTNKAKSTRTKKSRRRGAPHRCLKCDVSCTNDKWSPMDFIIDHHDNNPDCLESLFECQNPSCNYRGLTLSSLKMHAGSGRDKEKCISAFNKANEQSYYTKSFAATILPIEGTAGNAPFRSAVGPSSVAIAASHASENYLAQYSGAHHDHVTSSNLNKFMTNPTSTSEEEQSYNMNNEFITAADNDNDPSINTDTESSSSQEEHVTESDINCLSTMQGIMKSNMNTFTCDDWFRAGLELEQILRKACVPNYVFDKVMHWAENNRNNIPNNKAYLLSREALYKRMEGSVYGPEISSNMKPKQTIVDLPSGRKASISSFDFLPQAFSILNCPSLNPPGLKNTVFKNDVSYGENGNPFYIPWIEDDVNSSTKRYHGMIDDIETSFWYWKTCKDMNLDSTTDLLVPVILFLDATQLGGMSSHSLEPLMFTLGILRRQIRNNPKAWRQLGYIEDIMKIIGSAAMSPAEKLEDYHFILDHLLSSLKRACSSLDGFLYDFEMENGDTVQRKLHFRIIFIIGDTKGADAWVGRFGSHWNTKCLSRDCDIETIHSDKPDKDCKFLRFTDMEKMSEEELKSLSMRRIKNSAFRSPPNIFGSSPYGICAATPPESLHVHLLGLCVRLFQYLYEQLTADQKREYLKHLTDIANMDSSQGCRDDYPDFLKFRSGNLDQGHLSGSFKYSRLFIMYLAFIKTDVVSHLINKKGKKPKKKKKKKTKKKNDNGKAEGEENDVDVNEDEDEDEHNLQPAGEDDMEEEDSDDERLYDEEDTVLDELKDNEETLEPKALTFDIVTYNNLLKIIEDALGIFKWLTCPKGHPRKAYKGGKCSVIATRLKDFLKDYIAIAPRLEGMGLKLYKFHVFKHWYFYILLYGSPLNSDGARLESGHIENLKQLGRRTQQRASSVCWQCSERFYEKTLLERTCLESNISEKRGYEMDAIDEWETSIRSFTTPTDDDSGTRTASPFGPYFVIELSYSKNGKRCDGNMRWLKRGGGYASSKHQLPLFNKEMFESYVEKLTNFNNGIPGQRLTSIKGSSGVMLKNKTEETMETIRIRASPSFRRGRPWHDYVEVSWEKEGNDNPIPAKVMMIVDYTTARYEDVSDNDRFKCTDLEHMWKNPAIPKNDIRLIVHSVESLANAPPCNIKCRFAMHYVMQDSKTFHEIPHDVVAGTVFACPDMISECAEVNKNKQSRFDVLSDKIIVLKPINSWAGTFFDYDEVPDPTDLDNPFEFDWKEIE